MGPELTARLAPYVIVVAGIVGAVTGRFNYKATEEFKALDAQIRTEWRDPDYLYSAEEAEIAQPIYNKIHDGHANYMHKSFLKSLAAGIGVVVASVVTESLIRGVRRSLRN